MAYVNGAGYGAGAKRQCKACDNDKREQSMPAILIGVIQVNVTSSSNVYCLVLFYSSILWNG